MLITADLHNHSSFCDGGCSPQEMAKAAYEKGFSDFGFSGHSHADFDLPCSVRDVAGYIKEINRLKQVYKGKMRIYCGVEQDYLAPVTDPESYDYILGAVHYFHQPGGPYYAIDGTEQENRRCIADIFHGDGYGFCRLYYQQVAENVLKYHPDLVAHFDLLVKNNDTGHFFDEDSRRYRSYALEALEVCLDQDMILELNTGGMYRGFRRQPYPADFLLRELLSRGGRIALSADAHRTEAVGYMFEDMLERLRFLGFGCVWQWRNGCFVETPIR